MSIKTGDNGEMLLKKIPKKEQTMEMCKMAIKQNPLELKYASVRCLDKEICMEAVKTNPKILKYVPLKFLTKEMCELALEKDSKIFENVPETFRTPELCIETIEKDIDILPFISYEQRKELFNELTEFDVIKSVLTYDLRWLAYMPDRQDVRELCIKYMEDKFSIAKYMSMELRKSKEILNYQKSRGKVEFLEKLYDPEADKFKVRVKVVCDYYPSESDETKVEEDSYRVGIEFDKFESFYDFLDHNLENAELGDCRFDGVDLKKYDIRGAVINSEILDSQGLYDDTYYIELKKYIENNFDEKDEVNELVLTEEINYPCPIDEGYERIDMEHIPFFYISDIHLTHRICNKFKSKATKEEVHSYIKYLVNKMMSSVKVIPYNSYLLIAGDTSSIFEFSRVFYTELAAYWRPDHIIVVSGNHELWDPWLDMEENITSYRRFFERLGIIFLQNDLLYVESRKRYGIICEADILKMSEKEIQELVRYSSIVVLGGIGFSGLHPQYNASKIRYGKSFDEVTREEALQKDKQEALRFNTIYKKVLNILGKTRVIVMTHVKKDSWSEGDYNPYWIYLNGHDHRNFYEVNEERTIYADNQIGYKGKSLGLKYFYCDNDYDIFTDYQDGIYTLTKEQYIDFNKGKSIQMSFKREEGTIYMLKKNDVYMFLIYCQYSKRSRGKAIYMLNGGKLVRLGHSKLEDVEYYYQNLERYVINIKQLLQKYIGGQERISEFIKSIGGSGKIHGCIVDVEMPSKVQDYSYCHLFVNPIDGKVTPYFAYDTRDRIVYKDFKALLQAHERCKIVMNNYLRLENEAKEKLPAVRYSEQLEDWGDRNSMYDEGSYLYRISRIVKSLQYCTSKNIVRLWNEELLNYDFVRNITQANEIDKLVDDKLLAIDESDV